MKRRGVGAVLAALLLLVLWGGEVSASPPDEQQGTITGRVIDAQTGNPLSAAQVLIPELNLGSLTQQNGRFELQGVPAGSHTLTVQRLGYTTVTQDVTVSSGETATVDLQMSQSALALDEVVVTGTPGGTQRRALGNALTAVSASDVTERMAVSSMQDLLSARVPALNFDRVSGSVGEGSEIQIRGVSSFSMNAQPLIYVDGVRVNNATDAGPMLGRGHGVSTLDDFNPEDIESIEVIKGPAAATLYGTEASAGVIQIITKRGETGAPEFNVMVRQGTNFVIDPAGKLGGQGPDGRASGQWGCYPMQIPCPEENIFEYNMYEYARDVRGEELFGYGHTQAYSLSVRGGTDQVRYFMSGQWTDETGYIDYNTDSAISLRANLNVLLTDDLTIDVSTGYVRGDTRFSSGVPAEGGIWSDLQWSRGADLCSVNPDCVRDGFQKHFPSTVEEVEVTREYSRFTGGVTATHTFRDWLTNRLVVGLDQGWDTNRRYIPMRADGTYSQSPTGEVFYGRPMSTNQSLEWSATAIHQLTDRVGTATSVGAQYYTREREELTNLGRQFGVPQQSSINQTAIDQIQLAFNHTQNKSLGFFVQEQVDWDNRIFLTGALRFDDNSAFGAEFDALIYPKFQATWVISEEAFWNFDRVNTLRLRGAWGQSGRQPDVLAAQNIYGAFPGPGGAPGMAPVSPGNAEVGPEKSTELELGFDYAVLDERVSGEFTWYSQTVTDMLMNQPLLPGFGFPGTASANLGALDAWGWELTLDARVVNRPDFGFDLAFSADHTKNEITDIGEGIRAGISGPAGLQIVEGIPYPAIMTRMLVSADLVAPGQVTNLMCDSGTGRNNVFPGGEPRPCDEIPDARLLYGPATPTHTFSVSPTFTFRDLQVFASAQGQHGHVAYDQGPEWGARYHNTYQTLVQTDPMLLGSHPSSGIGDVRYWGRYDASHWKLREVGARYQLPASLVDRAGADRASISVSARDIWTIWRAQMYDWGGSRIPDPEMRSPSQWGAGSFQYGLNSWNQPPGASMHVTMRVTF